MSCKAQTPPPPGDGCGAELDYWYSAEPYKPAPKPAEPPREMMLSELPPACRTVLEADPVPGAVTMREAFALKLGLGTAAPADAGLAFVDPIDPAASFPDLEVARLPRPRPEGR
jgi:penicillin-insensitive murein endopeptidase